ncbi:MAG: 4Fe-4S binding protein [Chloroherpetonaceae bacterium]|nr:4Fe-4S binding protein [Chloroherpetonaceae bacterium]
MASEEEARALRRQRRLVQVIFVAINLILVDSRLPSVVWAVVGGAFWLAVVVITITNGPIVCSWVCWLGAAQDWAEPLAKRRWKPNPSFWRPFVLLVAIFWAPVSWLIRPEVMYSLTAPFGFDYTALEAHILQAVFFIVVGLSVAVLGKRGACIAFCPLLLVARLMRLKNWLPQLRFSYWLRKPIIINGTPAP